MKTKELIRLLTQEDPTGEEEVFVGSEDILFVESMPGYYDGHPQQLVMNGSAGVSSIVGGRVGFLGRKVVIHTYSFDDMLCDNPEKPIEIAEDNGVSISGHRDGIEQKRSRYREMNDAIDALFLSEEIVKQLKLQNATQEEIKEAEEAYIIAKKRYDALE